MGFSTEIKCPSGAVAFGLDFHPSERLLAAGLISGQLRIFRVGEGGCSGKRELAARPHTEACRSVRFDPAGTHLLSCSSDCSVQRRDIESNQPVWRMRRAHDSSINVCVPLGPHGVGTGDDDGIVHVWDVRQKGRIMRFVEHADLVNDLHFSLDKLQLACCSSDGHLSVYDLRKGRLEARSDELEEELLCLATMKGGKKLLAGTDSGVIGVFTWGDFGDFSDRMTPKLIGCADAVQTIAPLDDHVMLVASADGVLRAIALHPSRQLGQVGCHPEPLEKLAVDSEAAIAATSAHDGVIRLWDVRGFTGLRRGRGTPATKPSRPSASESDDDSDDDMDKEEEEAVEASPPAKKLKKGNLKKGPISLDAGFCDDL
eukprot:scaffold237897_cov30-Tisochrysis_lutea.AAC.1